MDRRFVQYPQVKRRLGDPPCWQSRIAIGALTILLRSAVAIGKTGLRITRVGGGNFVGAVGLFVSFLVGRARFGLAVVRVIRESPPVNLVGLGAG